MIVMEEKQNLKEAFVGEIKGIIDGARANAVRSVNFSRVQMYWNIGKKIFEEEQHGKKRADYGSYLIRKLAERLEPEYGSGFSKRQLEKSRQFYKLFPIASALRTQLNWTQYKLLIAISDASKREYYELEAVNNAWTSRELERQINSMLYAKYATVQFDGWNGCRFAVVNLILNVELAKTAARSVEDILLTRYACYLVE